MSRWLMAAAALLVLAAPAWAGLDEGFAAFERGDYETALREILPLAEQGNVNAQASMPLAPLFAISLAPVPA